MTPTANISMLIRASASDVFNAFVSPTTRKSEEEAVANAIEATQGYTLVVSNLKLLLETGSSAGLVEDKAALITEKQATLSTGTRATS